MFHHTKSNGVSNLVIRQNTGMIRHCSIPSGNYSTKYREWLSELATDFDNRIEIHSRKPIPDIMKVEDGELVFSSLTMGHHNISQLYDCESRELIVCDKDWRTKLHLVWPVTLEDVLVLLDLADYLLEKRDLENTKSQHYNPQISYDVSGSLYDDYRDPRRIYQDDLRAICHEHLPPLSVDIKSVIWDGDDRKELVFDHLNCGSCEYPTRCKYGNVGNIKTEYICAEMFLGIWAYCTRKGVVAWETTDGVKNVTIDAPIISTLTSPYGMSRGAIPGGVTWKNTFCIITYGNNYDKESIPDIVYQLRLMSNIRSEIFFKDPSTGKFVEFRKLDTQVWHSYPAIYLGRIDKDHYEDDNTIDNLVLKSIPDDYVGDLFVNRNDWDNRVVTQSGLCRFERHYVVNESFCQYHLRHSRAKSARK